MAVEKPDASSVNVLESASGESSLVEIDHAAEKKLVRKIDMLRAATGIGHVIDGSTACPST